MFFFKTRLQITWCFFEYEIKKYTLNYEFRFQSLLIHLFFVILLEKTPHKSCCLNSVYLNYIYILESIVSHILQKKKKMQMHRNLSSDYYITIITSKQQKTVLSTWKCSKYLGRYMTKNINTFTSHKNMKLIFMTE